MIAFDIVVAADEADGIGRAGQLPWKLAGDMAFFKSLTTEARSPDHRNAVIMGRKTWDSIPTRFRPLKQRFNIVVSRNPDLLLDAEAACANGLSAALDLIETRANSIDRTFVIGGSAIYRIALRSPLCRRVYLTRIQERFECDAFFPSLGDNYELTDASEPQEDNGITYVFETYQRRP